MGSISGSTRSASQITPSSALPARGKPCRGKGSSSLAASRRYTRTSSRSCSQRRRARRAGDGGGSGRRRRRGRGWHRRRGRPLELRHRPHRESSQGGHPLNPLLNPPHLVQSVRRFRPAASISTDSISVPPTESLASGDGRGFSRRSRFGLVSACLYDVPPLDLPRVWGYQDCRFAS